MAVRTNLQSAIRGSIGPLIAVALTIYFITQTFTGERGLSSRLRLEQEARSLREEMDVVQTEKSKLEARNRLLRSDSLDSDMLDERVREMLNYAHPDDVVTLRAAPR